MTSPGTKVLFTVVIPLFNRRDHIVTTLQSLISGGGIFFKIIVVDDGSTDGSDKIVSDFIASAKGGDVITLVKQQNAGPGAARNHGARLAQSRWIAFLDSDDLWMPWTPRILQQTLQNDPDLQAMLLQIKTFQDPVETYDWAQDAPSIVTHPSLLDMRLSDDRLSIYGSCNLAVRRDEFLKYGGFTDQTYSAEDTDFMYKAGKIGPVATIRAPVLVGYYDGGADSLSRDMRNVFSGAYFLINQERTGAYQGCGDDRQRLSALTDSMFYAINRFFRLGHPQLAYKLLWRAWPLFGSAGQTGRAMRLALTPILSVIRPKRYKFRWSPKRSMEPENPK